MQSFAKSFFFFGLLVTLNFVCYAESEHAAKKSKPHIILIVADDMGWNDVSFHGSNQIPTPNIDALAYNGVILNRHYVLPLCTPSRSALLTGRYPLRDGLQGVPLSVGVREGLPLNRTLMPEYFKKLGYNTHLVGKWHLGYYTKDHTPSRRGFDTFYGYYNGFITYQGHLSGQKVDYPPNGGKTLVVGSDFHRDKAGQLRSIFNETEDFTNMITNEAVKIIRKHRSKKDKPLFLKISHLAVHAGGRTIKSGEALNTAENNEIFKYIKDDLRRKYAGMMKALDDSVGKVVKTLGETGMLQNSIIVFMSDNGAPTTALFANSGSNYPLRGMKGTAYEGGVRGVACVFSPLIEYRGRVSEQTMHITDWLPTLYDAAGGNLADLQEIDGVNQWPSILDDNAVSPRGSTLLNFDELRGLEGALVGKYKLIKGASDVCLNCYGDSGDDPKIPKYHSKSILTSPVGLAISKLGGNHREVTKDEIKKLRKKSTVRCPAATLSDMNCTESCLFDVINDPCETMDLKEDQPETVKMLEEFLEGYRKVMKPQDRKPFDPCAHPKNFNDTWMPWMTDESSSETASGKCQYMDFD